MKKKDKEENSSHDLGAGEEKKLKKTLRAPRVCAVQLIDCPLHQRYKKQARKRNRGAKKRPSQEK